MFRIRKIAAAFLIGCIAAVPTAGLAAPRPQIEVTGNAVKLEQRPGGSEWFLAGLEATKQGTAARDVLELLSVASGRTVELTTASGAPVTSAMPAATGMRAVVRDAATGSTLDKCTLVVKGDVTGSGRMSLTQLVQMADALQNTASLTGPFLLAADRNGNGRLDLSDLVSQAEQLARPAAPTPAASAAAPGSSLMESIANPAAVQKRVREQIVSGVSALRVDKGIPALAQEVLLNDAAQVMAEDLAHGAGYGNMVLPSQLLDVRQLAVAYTVSWLKVPVRLEELASNVLELRWSDEDPAFREQYAYTGTGIAKVSGEWIVVAVYSDKAPTKWLDDAVIPNNWDDSVLADDLGASAPKPSSVPGSQSGTTSLGPSASPTPKPTLSRPAIQADPDYSGNVPAQVKAMISKAMGERGKEYEYGGIGPDAYDCSGLVYTAMRAAGLNVSRMSSAAYAANENWETVEKVEDLKTGDLVFFGPPDGIFHVGIYIGNDVMVHAAPSIGGVELSYMSEAYYASRFAWGKRVFS